MVADLSGFARPPVAVNPDSGEAGQELLFSRPQVEVNLQSLGKLQLQVKFRSPANCLAVQVQGQAARLLQAPVQSAYAAE
jgi:hypothetical protein